MQVEWQTMTSETGEAGVSASGMAAPAAPEESTAWFGQALAALLHEESLAGRAPVAEALPLAGAPAPEEAGEAVDMTLEEMLAFALAETQDPASAPIPPSGSAPCQAAAAPEQAATESAVTDPAGPEARLVLERTASGTPAVAMPAKRQNLGTAVLGENFPDGWEVLLDDGANQDLPVEALGTAAPKQNQTAAQPVQPETQAALPAAAPTGSRPDAAATAKNEGTLELFLNTPLERVASRSEARNLAGPAHLEKLAADTHSPAPLAGSDAWQTHQAPPVMTHTPATGAVPAVVPGITLARLDPGQKDAVITSFVQAAVNGLPGKRGILTIELNPPELGRVQVRVEDSGTLVNARLTIQDQSVGEFFQDRQSLIRKSLEEAGIKVGELSVSIAQQFTREEQPEREAARPGSALRFSGDGGQVSEAAQRWGRTGNGRVDMLI